MSNHQLYTTVVAHIEKDEEPKLEKKYQKLVLYPEGWSSPYPRSEDTFKNLEANKNGDPILLAGMNQDVHVGDTVEYKKAGAFGVVMHKLDKQTAKRPADANQTPGVSCPRIGS